MGQEERGAAEKAKRGSRRPAQVTAGVLNVCCPYCGEPQPNPDNGADGWTGAELFEQAAAGPKRECVSCDEAFLLVSVSTARVSR